MPAWPQGSEPCKIHAVTLRRYGPRVLRGGSWNNNTRNCRSSNRNRNNPTNRNNNNGFRVASAPVAGTGQVSRGDPPGVHDGAQERDPRFPGLEKPGNPNRTGPAAIQRSGRWRGLFP